MNTTICRGLGLDNRRGVEDGGKGERENGKDGASYVLPVAHWSEDGERRPLRIWISHLLIIQPGCVSTASCACISHTMQ